LENDKLFDFMSKIYNEMQQGFIGINSRLESIETDVKSLKVDVNEAKGDIGKTYAKLDGEIINKLGALEDGYKQTYEITADMRDKVNQNTEDIAEINMALSEMKDDINYIAGKTIKHDSRINKLSEMMKAAK
jgi:chromosome segregation ATPase